MRSQRSIWVFVAVILLLPFSVYGVVSWYQSHYKSLPVLADGKRLEIFSLLNRDGKQITPGSWKGKIVVANYFFMHCPSICPKMIYSLKRVQAYSGILDLQLASFTVDPERDRITRLQSYAEQFGIKGDRQLLTGDKTILYRLARKSFQLVVTDGDGGPGDFIHSEKLVLLDRQLRIRGYYKGTDETEVAQLIKDIQKLAAED
jgi:protein SCO1/2